MRSFFDSAGPKTIILMPSTTDKSPEEMFDQFVSYIKQFRKEVDASIQKAEACLNGPKEHGLSPTLAAREMALARTKLQEAKMWLGKVLEVAGNPFPAELADKADVQ